MSKYGNLAARGDHAWCGAVGLYGRWCWRYGECSFSSWRKRGTAKKTLEISGKYTERV